MDNDDPEPSDLLVDGELSKEYPLRGTPFRYDRPTDPVAVEDWEVLSEPAPLYLPASRRSDMEEIRRKVAEGLFELTKHAVDKILVRGIELREMREAIATGSIIEDYPQDKYGSSCLVLGWTAAHRPLHIQCTHPARPIVKIVTVYEPDPARWIDFKKRR